MNKIVIIGNGVAGISAALEIRSHTDDSITIVSDEHPYFYARTGLMYVYMGIHPFESLEPFPRSYYKDKKIDCMLAHVENLNTSNRSIELNTHANIHFDKLIIATGSKPNKLPIKNSEANGVLYFYSKQDLVALENHSKQCKNAIILGGGLIGIELAEMLSARNINVTMIIKEPHYWGNELMPQEAAIIDESLKENKIELRYSTTISEILTDPTHKVKGIWTSNHEMINCDLLCIAIGVSPNIEWLNHNTNIKKNKGILVNEYLETNQSGIYAIGDCAELKCYSQGRKNIEPIWYTARAMGITVGKTISGRPTKYDQGIWFNSAKFFDVEYQCYGNVTKNNTEQITPLVWISNDKKRTIRINYNKQSNTFLGIVGINIRMRQEIIEKAINQSISIKQFINSIEDYLMLQPFDKLALHILKNELQSLLAEHSLLYKNIINT